jgi:prephenate dehydrogenase
MGSKHVVGIVGTGLIGGSIGMRSRRNGATVFGCDRDPSALDRALAVGAIDASASRDELYARADTIVLAMHLEATLAELERLRRLDSMRAGLVVDVGSVKTPICAFTGAIAQFVATHPMAGSQSAGAGAARADLFDGRTWAYVSSSNGPLDARARAFIAACGGVPLAVAAAEHDRIVAFTSHLPQVIAWSYAAQARDRETETFGALKGTTSREMFRLAESDFEMWRDILRANGPNVEPELRRLGTSLLEAADRLRAGDVDGLRPASRRAGRSRRPVVDAGKPP